MDKKNCNHARRDMEEPRQLPKLLPRVRASDKNTLHHGQAAQKTQVWLPENIAEHTRPDIWPPALLIVGPSFILSVALEGNRLTN